MAEGSSPKQSLMSRDVTDDSQKEMRSHRAKVRELMSAGESFIATLNESTGYENVALINDKYHALDAEILACQGQASGEGKSESQGIYNRLGALRLNIIDVYQKWHASVQNNSGLTPLDIETHSSQNQMLSNTNTNMPNIEPSDSVSNVGSGSSRSCTSSQLARKQISLRLKRQKAEFQQKQREIEFELRQAELDAEEQMLHLSNPNSVVSARSRNQQTVCKPLPHTQPRKRLCEVTPEHTEEFANAQPNAQLYKPLVESIANTKSTPLRNYRGYSTQHDPYSQNRVSTLKNQEFQGSPHSSNSSHIALQEYHILLEEARKIRYSGRNLPFIFFQNQIRELIKRCPISHRKMDLLRASCQEGAREAISALVPPVPGWDIDTQITRALEGLRLRYGCCSFLAEPLVRQIRSGAKLPRMDAGTLEKLISDLNDCELYARAHQQMHSLDSNFIVDVGERLPYNFKKQYTYFLHDNFGSTKQPSFDSFKQFLNRELQVVKTTFAERFLCSYDRREKNRSTQRAKVHHTNVQTKTGNSATTTSIITRSAPAASAPSEASKWQQSPRCFMCSTETSEKRHFLYNCDNYQRLTPEEKRNAIIQAHRCLNCLQSHSVEDCKFPCKCKHCKQRMAVPKHTTSLHEIYNTSFPTYPSENVSSTERVAVGAASLPSYNQKASTSVVRKIEA